MSELKTGLSLENELKTVLKTGKVIIGAKRSIQAIKLGKAKAVVLATLIPKWIESDVLYYAKLSGVRVIRYKGSSYDLGALCGKPFPISTIAILDPGDSRILELEGG